MSYLEDLKSNPAAPMTGDAKANPAAAAPAPAKAQEKAAPPAKPVFTGKKLTRQGQIRFPSGVLGMTLSEDGTKLYAACADGVYEAPSGGGPATRLYEHESYASGAAIVPAAAPGAPGSDGTLVTAGYDGRLIWFDLKSRKITRQVKAHDFWSWKMAISPDGRMIGSATGQYLAGSYEYAPAPEREPSVRLFDASTGKLLQSLSHTPSVQSVAFSADSRHVAAGNLMGQTRVWECATGKMIAQWKSDAFTSWGVIKSHCHLGGIFSMLFLPGDGGLLAAGMGPMRDPMAGNGKQVWEKYDWAAQGEKAGARKGQSNRDECGTGLMEALALHPSGGFFVMAGRVAQGDWNAAIFDAADGKRLSHVNTGKRITTALFSGDGKQLFLGACQSQGGPKNGKFEAWGAVEYYEVG